TAENAQQVSKDEEREPVHRDHSANATIRVRQTEPLVYQRRQNSSRGRVKDVASLNSPTTHHPHANAKTKQVTPITRATPQPVGVRPELQLAGVIRGHLSVSGPACRLYSFWAPVGFQAAASARAFAIWSVVMNFCTSSRCLTASESPPRAAKWSHI